MGGHPPMGSEGKEKKVQALVLVASFFFPLGPPTPGKSPELSLWLPARRLPPPSFLPIRSSGPQTAPRPAPETILPSLGIVWDEHLQQ